jgi:hypothetical protein
VRARAKGRGKRTPALRRLAERAAAPFLWAWQLLANRLGEASSYAAIMGGVIGMATAIGYGQPKLGFICLALGLVQALVPDGEIQARPTRRRRRS